MENTDEVKRAIAEKIIYLNPIISAQVLTEVANVCKRRFRYSKEQVLILWGDLLTDCFFADSTKSTFHTAIMLSKKYDFQLFDSIIVASALENNCAVLYSEDMQHQMIVEKRLTIINPFKDN